MTVIRHQKRLQRFELSYKILFKYTSNHDKNLHFGSKEDLFENTAEENTSTDSELFSAMHSSTTDKGH